MHTFLFSRSELVKKGSVCD